MFPPKQIWPEFFQKPLIQKKLKQIKSELSKEDQKNIFPPNNLIFEAFRLVPMKKLRAVIIGQDPYHGPGQAHGLSFSVKGSQKIPPSLRNIFKEIKNDFANFEVPDHGDLTCWSKQGVLLLNRVLTVRSGEAASHRKLGWAELTAEVIEFISLNCPNLVFILWGKDAHGCRAMIQNPEKHLILESVHPSPLSAHRGFFGNKHFLKTNKYLEKHHGSGIDWQA